MRGLVAAVEAPLATTEDLERAIQRLQSDYWARVDFLDPAPAEDLFTEDSVFELGSLVLNGRAELGAFFRRRKETSAASARSTRHLSANLRLRGLEAGKVRASTTVLVMTGYGAFPIASEIPAIGDFEDVCVLGPEGSWLFERRKATSVFAGPDAPAFARGGPADGDRQETG